MCLLVDPAEVLGGHPCVDLSGSHGHVPEQLLDHTDVGTVGEHVRGARMTEHMGVHAVGEPHRTRPLLQDSPDALPREPPSMCVQEHRLGVAAACPALGSQLWSPPQPEPVLEGRTGTTPYGHEPLLATFAQDAHEPRVGAEVRERQARKLRDPHPGAVEHLEDRPVTAGEGIRLFAGLEEADDVLLVEGLREA